MQELTSAPQMTSPYTPAGGSNMPTTAAQPPKLGTPIPGTTGGLAAKPGLTVYDNPLAQPLQSSNNNPQQSAQQLQNFGRGNDTMLIHMTPEEVGGLQQLALASGGSLTINPHTGLPEAGWLGKLLPTILGAVGMAFGIPPIWMGVGGAAVGTIATGDLGKGLSMGLQAYGGASLGGAAGIGGKLGHVGQGLGLSGSSAAVMHPMSSAANVVGERAANMAIPFGDIAAKHAALSAPVAAGADVAQAFSGMAAPTISTTALPGAVDITKLGATSGFGGFGAAAQAGLPGGIVGKTAPMLAASGVMGGLSEASQPNLKKYNPDDEDSKWNYEGPYRPIPRKLNPTVTGNGEINYFDQSNPIGYLTASGQMRGYAEGGDVKDDEFQKRVNNLITQGYVDPKTGVLGMLSGGSDPLGSGGTIGMTSSLGGLRFVVNDKGKWEYLGPLDTSVGPPQGGIDNTNKGDIKPIGGGVTPGTGTGANLTGGITGYGVDKLDKPYIPQFTAKDDYVTQRRDPYTLGTQLSAMLPQATSRYQTSPGPITALNGYPGGSPSELIRAAAQANAAKPPASSEQDYGFTKSAGALTPAPNVASSIGTEDFWANLAQQYGMNPTLFMNKSQSGYAHGGEVDMGDGSFVIDARTVSELGNGSSNAGREILARMGGRPLNGPGDGVSDSIPARIGGRQEARVARDEVIMPPQAVRRIGGGSEKRGTQKLYDLMNKAHKARKNAKRGQDTKLARGLGAIA